MQKSRTLLAGAAVTLVVLAGCSSSKSVSSGESSSTTASGSSSSLPVGSSADSGKTISVGLLVDESGLGASGNKTAVEGVKAGMARAAKDGYHLTLYTADTQTSPSAALAAAQKLVEQDHVDVVLSQSSLTFAAAPWLASHHIPVIGSAEDGPEWTTDDNMFSVYGANNATLVSTVYGQFFKMEGATSLGAIGYGISPISSEEAEGEGRSVQAAGLKAGYINADFPFGSTNVVPASLAMKAAGIDAFSAAVDPNTGFAFVQELRTLGVTLKAVELPTGYGGDLTQAGPNAERIAKGIYFGLSYEPIEMHTAATEQISTDLASVGVTGDPTYAEYDGYAAIAMLVQALQSAGSDPNQASILAALSGIHSFDAWGLLGSHPLDVNNRTPSGLEKCSYFAQWNGTAFQLVSGAEPLCGSILPGVTVKAQS